MALTESKPFTRAKAADFALRDVVSGQHYTLSSFTPQHALVVMFICNHCPFVQHIQSELVRLAQDYQPKGVAFVAISSNDVENYPQDAPELMKKVAEQYAYPFPYLFDDTQETAKAYGAECTPDFFVFDAERNCCYNGRLDGARPGNDTPVTGEDMRCVLDALVAGKTPSFPFKPSLGCNIKWKS